MLNLIRYKLAIRLAKNAHRLINTGDFKKIMRGLRYFKWSVVVVPPSDDIPAVGECLPQMAEEEREKLLEDQG